MRKILTSKLKSNESLFLAAMQKHFALCLHSAKGQVAASSLPPHHTSTDREALLPSIPGADHRGEENNFSPTMSIFQEGSLWSYSSPKTQLHHHGKEKYNGTLLLLQAGLSEETPSTRFSWCSKLSQFCDNVKPNPSPFVSAQAGFASFSFPIIFLIPTESPGIQRKGKRNRGRGRELNIKQKYRKFLIGSFRMGWVMGTRSQAPISTPGKEGPPCNLPHPWTALRVLTQVTLRGYSDSCHEGSLFLLHWGSYPIIPLNLLEMVHNTQTYTQPELLL